MRPGPLGILLILPLLSATAAGCSRPNVVQCEQLCKRFSELSYFEQGDDEQRRAAWEKMQSEPAFVKQLDNCVTQCRFEGGTKQMVACVEAAQTAAQARSCMAEED